MVQKKKNTTGQSGKLDGKYVEWYESGQEKSRGNIPTVKGGSLD